MSATLGEKLREAREGLGISISEVSEQTRISSLYLEAIENDNYKTLPGGIFNKGFVKSYARYIGFDEQEALQDYAAIVAENEGTEEDHLKQYRPEVLTDDRSTSSIVPTVIFAVIILGLMTGGILFVVNYIQNQPDVPTTASNTNSAINQNTNVVVNSNSTGISATVPTMGNVKIELKANGESVSVTAVIDGKSSSVLVTPDKPAVFEPKEDLKLSYSRSRAQFAQLTINGKPISLPAAPANPKRNAIEININRDNLAQFWQTGEITFGVVPTPTTASQTPAETSTPAPVGETQNPAPSQTTPKPPGTPAVRAVGTPIPIPTPIVIGSPRPRVATPRPSPN